MREYIYMCIHYYEYHMQYIHVHLSIYQEIVYLCIYIYNIHMYTSQYIRVERIDSSHGELSPARPSANAAACCALPQEGVGHGGSWHVQVLHMAPLKTTRKMYILGRSQEPKKEVGM